MSLTVDAGKSLITEFCAIYPVAYHVQYRVRETQEELYGKEATKQAVGTILGSFRPGRGQADFATSNFRNEDEFKVTLRHEILGHFGINTFTASDKRAVLNAILDARDQPGISELWNKIDKLYSGATDLMKAEEVYAFACEGITPEQQLTKTNGAQSFQDVCLTRSRLMQVSDLINITSMVADGMRDKSRSQQIFPASDYEQFKRDTSMDTNKRPFHMVVAEKLIEQLKAGTAPWQKPWEPGESGAFMPMNPSTGKRYKGINAIQLMSQGYSDQRWMTYKQAGSFDAQVRKGEKGTPIQYWKFTEEQTVKDAAGKPARDSNGDPIKKIVDLERPRVFFATVFNAEQIDGLPALQPRKQPEWSSVERAEKILLASGASLRHCEDRAFYRPSTDSIHLPDKSQFATADNYYATALHELGHWTGHKSRLDRDLNNPFGSEGYAKEELRAEIASMILGDELGIGHDPEQHAAYVGSWVKVLENEPIEIFRAAADAEKIQEFVLGFEQQLVQEKILENAVPDSQEVIMVELQRLHRSSIVGYSPLESWENFSETAALNGFKAEIRRGKGEEYGVPYLIGYRDKTGRETNITTGLYPDGKAASSVNGRRTEPSHMSSDHESQSMALTNAFTQYLSQESAQRESLVQGQVRENADFNSMEVIMDELQRHHRSSIVGFSPLESWENLSQTAVSNGFKAEIRRGTGDEYGVPYMIGYRDKTGRDTNITTGLSDNGGAATSVNGGRTDRLYMTSDHETQKIVLVNAFSKYLSPESEQEIKMDLLPDGFKSDQKQSEAWMIKHVERGTLAERFVTASLEQLNRMDDMFTSMLPLNTMNDFWVRHELPKDIWGFNDKIDRDSELLNDRILDAQVAASRHDEVLFQQKSQDAFDFILPQNWNGNVEVLGNILETVNGEPHVTSAETAGVEPAFWSVYAQKSDNTYQWLADTENRQMADELAERLALVDANSQSNELERAAKLARIVEDRVRRDPKSTNEDISAAREARKSAESLSVQNDTDLQRRVAEIEREQKSITGSTLPGKTMLDVPFKQKDEAKGLGAKWDRQEQSWYVPAGVDQAPFAKWMVVAEVVTAASKSDAQPLAETKERQYLAVPYGERAAAKAAGAKWDGAAKSWYAGDKADIAKLERWKPEHISAEQAPAMSPQEEFAEALRSLGCVVKDKHPVMDGNKHRIPVEGDKKGEQAGFYVGHLDGHPAGYIKNNKTGIEMKWKSKGYALDPEQKAKLQAEAAAKLQARETEQARLQERTAARVSKQLGDLVEVVAPTPYMKAKGIEPRSGLYTDTNGQKTYIPAIDSDGKQWTMQYIQEDGTKRFAKDSKKEGCFHVIGGLEALAEAPAIVIGEGYATANSLSQALGYATVAAFDSGNLAHVAKSLQSKYPDKPVIIAGDDDKHLEVTQGINPGRSKADEAAKLVGGARMFPIFAPGEQAGNPKGFTDFNDLATKSVLGKEGIERQVNSYVDSIVAKHTVKLSESRKDILQQSESLEPQRRSVRL